MKTAHRFYLLLCIGLGIAYQANTPRPDYFEGAALGLVSSWIGPGMIARAVCEAAGQGKLGVPAMLGISLAFWLLFFKIARRPRRAKTVAVSPVALDPSPYMTVLRTWRTSTRTTWEDE